MEVHSPEACARPKPWVPGAGDAIGAEDSAMDVVSCLGLGFRA